MRGSGTGDLISGQKLLDEFALWTSALRLQTYKEQISLTQHTTHLPGYAIAT